MFCKNEFDQRINKLEPYSGRYHVDDIPMLCECQHFRRPKMQSWNYVVCRAVQANRMEFDLLNMNALWHRRLIHHSTMNWNLWCRCCDSQQSYFDTIWAVHSVLSRHSSPMHSEDLCVHLSIVSINFNMQNMRNTQGETRWTLLPIINPYFWFKSIVLFAFDCDCSPAESADLFELNFAIELLVFLLWFCVSQLKFDAGFSSSGLLHWNDVCIYRTKKIYDLIRFETSYFAMMSRMSIKQIECVHFTCDDWSFDSDHSAMGCRVDIGTSDIILFMLDDELQWEPLIPSGLLLLTCDDFSILSIRLFTDRRVSWRWIPTRWRRCAISCWTTEFSREFCESWLAMAATDK